VLIGVDRNNIGAYHEQALFLSSKKGDLRKAIKICSGADIVVLYGLGRMKSYIAINLPQHVIIAWRFFGTELYTRNIKDYLSKQSLLIYNNKWWSIKRRIKKGLSGLFYLLIYGYSKEKMFQEAISRIDLFLGLSKMEYEYLLRCWEQIPRFMQLSVSSPFQIDAKQFDKDNTIIIGNSRTIFNNHLDIIDMIEKLSFDDNLSFILPFSYGDENYYTREVRSRIGKSSKKISILDDFIERDEYYNLITSSKAAIFNGYRQMAMGNIFQLLRSGTKVYLNTNNIMYHWLIDLGVIVFTVNDFKNDLLTGNLELEKEKKYNNAYRMQQLKYIFNQMKFANDIVAFSKDKVEHIYREYN